MLCPKCGTDSLSALCWVDTSPKSNMGVLEAAGDLEDISGEADEPEPLAFCGDCCAYLVPPEGFCFRAEQAEPHPYMVHAETGERYKQWPLPCADCDQLHDPDPEDAYSLCPKCTTERYGKPEQELVEAHTAETDKTKRANLLVDSIRAALSAYEEDL